MWASCYCGAGWGLTRRDTCLYMRCASLLCPILSCTSPATEGRGNLRVPAFHRLHPEQSLSQHSAFLSHNLGLQVQCGAGCLWLQRSTRVLVMAAPPAALSNHSARRQLLTLHDTLLTFSNPHNQHPKPHATTYTSFCLTKQCVSSLCVSAGLHLLSVTAGNHAAA